MSRVQPSLQGVTCAAPAPTSDRRWLLWLLVALIVAPPVALFAQDAGERGDGFLFRRPVVTLAIRGGYDRPAARSDLYDFTIRQLTLDRRDFAAVSYAVDVGVRVAKRLDLVFSGGDARSSKPSEFRDFIDTDDKPIRQTTSLRRLPLTVGVRYALTSPGEQISRLAWIPSRFTPWVGLGGGLLHYNFRQTGDFVDFNSLNVFPKTFASKGQTAMAYANLGADLSLNERFMLTGDVRYSAARTPLSDTFEGFDRIDLSGTAATIGISVRY